MGRLVTRRLQTVRMVDGRLQIVVVESIELLSGLVSSLVSGLLAGRRLLMMQRLVERRRAVIRRAVM